MKNTLFILLALIFVAVVLFPSPVYAFNGVEGIITDGKTSQRWTASDVTITIYASVGGTPTACGTTTMVPADNGSYSISYTCTPDIFSNVYVLYSFADAANGTPSSQTETFVELPPVEPYVLNIVTDTGPTAIELTEFSVTTQSSSNIWLPFVLLVGSVALVSGAVAVIRKRRA